MKNWQWLTAKISPGFLPQITLIISQRTQIIREFCEKTRVICGKTQLWAFFCKFGIGDLRRL